MIETIYILKDCCGGTVYTDTTPIKYSHDVCDTCGDAAVRGYVLTYVRANVPEPVLAKECNLSEHFLFSDIREIDTFPGTVWVVPFDYSVADDCNYCADRYGGNL